jgi:hypothetical protein
VVDAAGPDAADRLPQLLALALEAAGPGRVVLVDPDRLVRLLPAPT